MIQMKVYTFQLTVLMVIFFASANLYAFEANFLTDSVSVDTVKSKEAKKKERQEERVQLRHSHNRFGIKFNYVYAFLDTEVSFDLDRGNLNSTLSLENNLGLPSNSFFFTGSFLYRITPRSGIYAQYYGINRAENSQTSSDIIFLRDTIPEGTDVKVYFNTQVISAGYMFSVLRNPDAFLGFYFNIYFMLLETGVKSEIGDRSPNVELIAPLPNFGIIATFKLNKWLYLNGEIGFFSLHTSTFGGSLHSFNLSFMARPVKWLGINLSYQEFDVRAEFLSDNIRTDVDYNFRGPSIGLSFFF